MAKHRKVLSEADLQQKADDFDKQWNESKARGDSNSRRVGDVIVGDELSVDKRPKTNW